MPIPALTSIIALIAAGFALSRKWPAGRRRLRLIYAFRAGRKFYASYPHIAKDIAYGDRPRQRLDVYWPPHPSGAQRSGDRLPVFLFVHGGSWNWGDKLFYPLVGARFTALGFVVVIINYTLYPQVTFPTFVEDTAAAIAWTVRHIDAYHGDPDRLFVAGHSAGAHLLALVALDDRYLAAHGLTRDVLRGFIAASAPTDLSALLQHLEAHKPAGSADALRAVMGGPDRLPQADPIRHVRGDAPPILLLHGVRDETVPIAIAREFASALRAAGVSVELREYDRADHYSVLLDGARGDPDHPARLLVDALQFVQQIDAKSIRPQAAPTSCSSAMA